MRCKKCGFVMESTGKIQTCKKCSTVIYPVTDKNILSSEDLEFQESRKRRRVRKLDFEIR